MRDRRLQRISALKMGIQGFEPAAKTPGRSSQLPSIPAQLYFLAQKSPTFFSALHHGDVLRYLQAGHGDMLPGTIQL